MRTLLVVLTLGFVSPAIADGGPDFFTTRNVKIGDTLKVRNDPTPHATWEDYIDPGTRKIRNLGCISGREIYTYLKNDTLKPSSFNNQTWCKIEVPSTKTIGWANAAYLRED